MFIVHGKQRTERTEGYVADFCSLCRAESAFRLVRVGLAAHLYGISAGAGELTGYTRVCLRCGIETWTDRERYSAVQKTFTTVDLQSSIRLGQLIQQTQPGLRSRLAERFGIEDQIRRNPQALDHRMRHALIKEPFTQVAYVFDKRFEATHIDLPLFATAVAGIAATIAAPVAAHDFLGADAVPRVFLVVLLLALTAILVQALRVKSRYLSKRIFPTLATALKPLAPKPQEIDAALLELRKEKLAIAKHIRTPALMAFWVVTNKRQPVIS
jgi:hypothetical protein